MEEVKLFLAVVSTLIAVAAFIIAINERRNRKKSEKLTFLRNALLGNKQEIGYIGYDLANNPNSNFIQNKREILPLLCLAYVFSKSSRTHAMILSALQSSHFEQKEISEELNLIKKSFKGYQDYQLEPSGSGVDKYLKRIEILSNAFNRNINRTNA